MVRKARRGKAMSSYSLKLTLCLCLVLPHMVSAQDEDVKAAVAASIQQSTEIWAGQQVTLNLDLKTTGFSFSNTHFNLPEVSNSFLMQPDSTTIKMSEKKDGEDWQQIRYPLALFPQKSGLITIPPIDVRFSTSAGFGKPIRNFDFKTEPLKLSVSLPPGVGQDELVVTTRSFQLEHNWQPESAIAKTGDAFTLTVTRRAADISAMLLPPIPVYRTDGLAAYPQAPEIEDQTNRGDLTGRRIDSITWVVEKAGSYEIPGIRFQWWDPAKRELKQQVIPGIKLDIVDSSTHGSNAVADKSSEAKSRHLLPWLMFALVGILAGTLWRKSRQDKDGKHLVDEKSTFTRLQKTCKSSQAGKAHSAIYAWLACCPPLSETGSQPVTLGELAKIMNDDQLARELEELQQAMISSPANWNGDALLIALKRIRHRINTQKIVQSRNLLAPLNP
jgi:hypothetical protein